MVRRSADAAAETRRIDASPAALVLRRQGPIAVVTLNRPRAYNAMDKVLLEALGETMSGLHRDDAVRAVVVTGEGAAFSAGGDLKSVLAHAPDRPGDAFHAMVPHLHRCITEIRRMPKPVIAAINGVAAGGGFSLALACDLRIMARSATMRQAYTAAGLTLDGGGTFTLPRLVGLARALEIAMLDAPIDAERARAWGLVTAVVDDAEVLPFAVGMAERLARGAVGAMGAVKRLMNASYETPLETQLEREREGLVAAADGPEGREGIAAFTEKRKARFMPRE